MLPLALTAATAVKATPLYDTEETVTLADVQATPTMSIRFEPEQVCEKVLLAALIADVFVPVPKSKATAI